mmetsp:Transcript_21739/g.32206  ORF Transcript_21739/g.32206 Transcript_21739/m.32206 type:complete len:304 (+) Transcript_21739:162-1073(+)
MATIPDKYPDFAAPKLNKSKDSDVHQPNTIDDMNESIDSTDSLDDLLPPSKLYAGKNGDKSNIDADLDAMLEIDMDDVAKQKLKRRAEFSERKKKSGCCKCVKIGNTIVWNQALYKRWRIGMIGPHWCGVLFTLGLLLFASYYFTMKAYHDVGIISAGICIWLTVQATVSLFLVSCRDPGIVLDADICAKLFGEDALNGPGTSHRGGYSGLDNHAQGEEEGWRYCGVCEVYQPPDAAHCPDCNVCVDEYDHHCPWMGCCVGKDNYRDFMVFNMTWLVYLIYACAWVTALGPQMMGKEADSGEE